VWGRMSGWVAPRARERLGVGPHAAYGIRIGRRCHKGEQLLALEARGADCGGRGGVRRARRGARMRGTKTQGV
jgi:hypothetical protein